MASVLRNVQKRTFTTLFAGSFFVLLDCHILAEEDSLIQPDTNILSMERIFTGQYSGMQQPNRLVVRDTDQWRSLWNEVIQNSQSTKPLPPVDFSHFMVIIAAMGMRRTGGHKIEIEKVYSEKERIEVVVHEFYPGLGCMVTQELTSPVDIVTIHRSDKIISFIEHQKSYECD